MTIPELIQFATENLRVGLLSSGCTQEPFYSQELIPFFRRQGSTSQGEPSPSGRGRTAGGQAPDEESAMNDTNPPIHLLLTLRAGRIVYERDGRALPHWRAAPEPYWQIPALQTGSIERLWRARL